MFALLISIGAWADVTGNLIYSTANPPPPGVSFQWSGFIQTPSNGGGLEGGHIPGYNANTGTFMFGYAQGTIAYALAINSALSGTGIHVGGIQYGFQYLNQDFNRGLLSTTVDVYGSNGQLVQSYYHLLPQTTEGWTQFEQSRSFAGWYGLASLSTAYMTWTGRDDRGWAGYYGPQFRDQYLRLTYTTDTCQVNVLSSPDCPGYQQAYYTQQCAANPLYDSTCPGYATAYHNQQCSINPLYAATCPGYQQAYYNQQCSISALYDPGCPGYQQAYYDQQCSINPLYDSGCANYDLVYAATQPPVAASEPTTVAQADTAAVAEPAATSTTSPTSVSPAAVVSVINPAPSPAAPAASSQSAKSDAAKAEAKTAEQKKTDQAVARSIPRGTTGAAAAKAAADKADEAAADSASATTIEAQQAAQNLVMGLMGFNPAFSAYQNAIVPDINAATMARQYNQPTVDNRSALRQLSGASDRLHQDMVDQQYGRISQ